METLSFEISYMPDAEPTGNTTGPLFELFRANMTALFQGSGKEIQVPKTLAELEEIPSGSGIYTKEEIFDLARKYRSRAGSGKGEMAVHILFANGFLYDEGEKKKDVVGLSSDGERAVVIFRGAIEEKTKNQAALRSTFEQTVMIHEAGHAIGLVESGLPSTTSHHDAEHPGHCTNPNCVMHYKMEGGASLLKFLQNAFANTRTVLFGQECIDDVRKAISPASAVAAGSP
jgi:hypothetical protein